MYPSAETMTPLPSDWREYSRWRGPWSPKKRRKFGSLKKSSKGLFRTVTFWVVLMLTTAGLICSATLMKTDSIVSAEGFNGAPGPPGFCWAPAGPAAVSSRPETASNPAPLPNHNLPNAFFTETSS
ncbi:MAG: hypothetical protein BWY73_00615 [candidate division TA06 bacterium ADurb.Bin417]|uniref:Uncharacterized protein n=1 Tax=candidate division TA06 bacterium ADurb.Bin417 TaxID=1852828 RepID=A0A1V5MHX1_UNCT6|nr:MAG: hypothetical protein BWY73_00615 [candidate division TA06 bacterium ADurb.Bin417]